MVLENAGFLNVQLEDDWWDVGAAYGDVDHHRPDITCEHPKTHAKYVFDVVVWWGATTRASRGSTLVNCISSSSTVAFYLY